MLFVLLLEINLDFLDVTSNSRTIAVFSTVDIKPYFTQFVGVFIYLHIILLMSSCSCPLIITIKPEAEYRFYAAATLFCSLQKIYFDTSYIFFKVLLLHIFQDPTQGVVSTSQVSMSAMLVLPIVVHWKNTSFAWPLMT
jgi:hypothetical protein